MSAPSPLRVLLADDEAMARKRLERLLSGMEGVTVVAVCATGEAALAALESTDVDVAVLDVQMPGLTGLDVADAAAELGVEIVLATAHPEHAVRAFESGVADYVLKPVEAERLATALARARARIPAPPSPSPSPSGPRPLERLAVTVNGEVRLLAPAQVAYAMLEGALVALRVDAELLWTELSLQDLERRLPAEDFLRVHRRALLNLRHLDRLRPLPTGGYTAVTHAGHEVPVSRQEARRLRRRLGL